jgi:hypothetical protein
MTGLAQTRLPDHHVSRIDVRVSSHASPAREGGTQPLLTVELEH